MSHTVTPAAEYNADALVRTVDGELWSDTSGPGPYGPLVQLLANRTLYARGAVWGVLSWNGNLSVDAGGSNTTFVVRVGIIQAVTLRDSANVWRPYFTATETQITLSHVAGAPANLDNDAWYYIYAWSDSGSPGAVKFQISLDPPTESSAPTVATGYKRGQTANYRYLGCFRTDNAGAPLPMRTVGGRCTYIEPAVLHTVTSNGLKSLAARIPPHARVAALRGTVTRASSTGNLSANVRETSGGGVGTYAWGVVMIGVDVFTSFSGSFEITPNASQEVYASSAGADSALQLTVSGFSE